MTALLERRAATARAGAEEAGVTPLLPSTSLSERVGMTVAAATVHTRITKPDIINALHGAAVRLAS